MKKQTLIPLLVIIVLLVAIYGVLTAAKGPEQTLEEFELAYNMLDAEAMLDCIAPKYSAPLKAGMSVLSKLVGIEVNDVISMIPLLSMFDTDVDMPQVRFNVLDVTINGKTATIDMEITAYYSGTAETVRLRNAGFIKQNGTWYIDIENGWD